MKGEADGPMLGMFCPCLVDATASTSAPAADRPLQQRNKHQSQTPNDGSQDDDHTLTLADVDDGHIEPCVVDSGGSTLDFPEYEWEVGYNEDEKGGIKDEEELITTAEISADIDDVVGIVPGTNRNNDNSEGGGVADDANTKPEESKQGKRRTRRRSRKLKERVRSLGRSLSLSSPASKQQQTKEDTAAANIKSDSDQWLGIVERSFDNKQAIQYVKSEDAEDADGTARQSAASFDQTTPMTADPELLAMRATSAIPSDKEGEADDKGVYDIVAHDYEETAAAHDVAKQQKKSTAGKLKHRGGSFKRIGSKIGGASLVLAMARRRESTRDVIVDEKEGRAINADMEQSLGLGLNPSDDDSKMKLGGIDNTPPTDKEDDVPSDEESEEEGCGSGSENSDNEDGNGTFSEEEKDGNDCHSYSNGADNIEVEVEVGHFEAHANAETPLVKQQKKSAADKLKRRVGSVKRVGSSMFATSKGHNMMACGVSPFCGIDTTPDTTISNNDDSDLLSASSTTSSDEDDTSSARARRRVVRAESKVQSRLAIARSFDSQYSQSVGGGQQQRQQQHVTLDLGGSGSISRELETPDGVNKFIGMPFFNDDDIYDDNVILPARSADENSVVFIEAPATDPVTSGLVPSPSYDSDDNDDDEGGSEKVKRRPLALLRKMTKG